MFYKRHYKDEPVDEQTLHDEYQIALDKVLLTDIERDEALEKGTRALHAWYEKNKSSIRKSLSEQAIPEFELFPGVKITGNIDRIEFRENDRVVVVDYKTGKPKSRNHLIGNTNSSDGAYYRQLVFYKLLLNHWKGGRYKMEHGIIDFVEPDESGKLRDEVFEIPDEEVASLTERIEQVAFEIKNLLFWDKEPTDECAYQDLVRVIRGY